MLVVNAIKKLEAAVLPGTFEKVGQEYRGVIPGTLGGRRYIVSFSVNGREEPGASACCFQTCPEGLESDPMTDYFPGSFWRNLSQAIAFAGR